MPTFYHLDRRHTRQARHLIGSTCPVTRLTSTKQTTAYCLIATDFDRPAAFVHALNAAAPSPATPTFGYAVQPANHHHPVGWVAGPPLHLSPLYSAIVHVCVLF